jgi:Zn-dependent protease
MKISSAQSGGAAKGLLSGEAGFKAERETMPRLWEVVVHGSLALLPLATIILWAVFADSSRLGLLVREFIGTTVFFLLAGVVLSRIHRRLYHDLGCSLIFGASLAFGLAMLIGAAVGLDSALHMSAPLGVQ